MASPRERAASMATARFSFTLSWPMNSASRWGRSFSSKEESSSTGAADTRRLGRGGVFLRVATVRRCKANAGAMQREFGRGARRGIAPLTRGGAVIYNRAVIWPGSRWLAGALTLLLGAALRAQTPGAGGENSPQPGDPLLVTCGEKPPLASHAMKGEVLVAPDGKHRAYSEVEATALATQRGNGFAGPLCVNTSRLYVSADSGDFQLRFLQEPADVETGNSLRLVDWSSDGRRLLAELAEWQYEQPGVTHSILVYDSRYGTFQQPDLPHLLAKLYDRECGF